MILFNTSQKIENQYYDYERLKSAHHAFLELLENSNDTSRVEKKKNIRESKFSLFVFASISVFQ